MRIFLLSLIMAVVLTSCSTYTTRKEFDKSLTDYNDLLRWHQLDKATPYIAESILEQFKTWADTTKNLRITDYHIVSSKYDEQNRKASADVEFEYFTFSSYRLRTLHDRQKWSYLEEDGERRWRLVSPPPEFK
ncbi:MAG: hypothetical protein ACLPX5_05300 [Dissulfurispiraceae bacterium]